MGVKGGFVKFLQKDFPKCCFTITKFRQTWTQKIIGFNNKPFSIPVKDQQMDHLYVDLNNIIHVCIVKETKKNSKETKEIQTEEQVEEDEEEEDNEVIEELEEPLENEDEEIPIEKINLKEIIDNLIVEPPSKSFIENVCKDVLQKLEEYFRHFEPTKTYFISMVKLFFKLKIKGWTCSFEQNEITKKKSFKKIVQNKIHWPSFVDSWKHFDD
jgi:hypothetical protein